MPFTPAHIAAVLPFRRTRMLWSALVVGAVAPDLEYFLRMSPQGRYGHTLAGLFVFTLPLGLLTLWLFHAFVKAPFVDLMPDSLARRLASPGVQISLSAGLPGSRYSWPRCCWGYARI